MLLNLKMQELMKELMKGKNDTHHNEIIAFQC